MRILVLGANGMLGHQVARRLAQDAEVWATVRNAPSATLTELVQGATLLGGISAEVPESVVAALRSARPETVINCIGIVKQHAAAREAIPSIRVNALFPHQLAGLCRLGGTRLLHLSTDCVFSGRRGAYREDDEPDPEDLYGRTKLLGEVTDEGALTMRTSMIGWQFSGSTGLLEWLADHRDGRVDGYRNAVFSGLTTATLSDVIAEVVHRQSALEGLYHVSAAPISKHNLLEGVVRGLGWSATVVPKDEPVIDRSLDSEVFQKETGWTPPEWDDMIARLAEERESYERWRLR